MRIKRNSLSMFSIMILALVFALAGPGTGNAAAAMTSDSPVAHDGISQAVAMQEEEDGTFRPPGRCRTAVVYFRYNSPLGGIIEWEWGSTQAPYSGPGITGFPVGVYAGVYRISYDNYTHVWINKVTFTPPPPISSVTVHWHDCDEL